MASSHTKSRLSKAETLVRRLIADVLHYLAVDVDFRVTARGPYAFTISLWGPDLELLRSSGETIWKALAFLLQQMASRSMERAVEIRLEPTTDDPRKLELQELARRAAKEALRRGKPIFLKPMSAWERRIIHMTLQDHPDVYTRSQGEEPHRRVGIFPRRPSKTRRRGPTQGR